MRMRFPLKKIRKQFKLLLLLVLLMFAIGFTYLHINQGKAIKLHFNYGKDMEKQADGIGFSHKKHLPSSLIPFEHDDAADSQEDGWGREELNESAQESRANAEMHRLLGQKFLRLPWKPEYKGQANLHVFEDWCGSSISQLRKNLHFPLYPHTRTTVKKIAVAPKWKNYGLRVFGFIHPYKDGDFQFAIASDDNSELWLSSDESPLNARLLVYVGQHGSEWTAPGEFSKFRSQTSKPVRLMSSRRYYFEVLHKQDDRGSDHVEVGWRPFLPGLKYDVIDSAYISLYTDESSLKMNSVRHIPQTLASHSLALQVKQRTETHSADMLKPDPRDSFYKIPMIDQSRLENVLPSCVYSPTYVVKDFPIARYQGLQFVYLSYVYPNDFTRLTQMEKKNKCFYRESPVYLEKFGFYKYMKMDEEEDDQPVFFPKPDDFLEEEEGVDPEETIISSNQPVRRTSPPYQMSRITASSKPDRLDRGSKSYVLQQERQYSQLKEQERSKRTKGERFYKHSLVVDDEMTEIRQSQAKGSAGALESQSGSLNEQTGASEEHGDSQTSALVQRGRSLTWQLHDTGLPNKSKLTETASPPVKGSSLFKLPQKSSLYVLANRILGSAGKPVVGTSVEKETNTNKIYITRPRPPVSRPKPPVEVFPGVFLYQSRKTKRLVDLSSKWRSLKTQAAASLPWPNFSLMGHKTSTQTALLKHSHSSLPTEPGPHNKGDPTAFISDPDSLPPSSSEKRGHPGLNSSENSRPPVVQPTKISEMPGGSDMAPQSRGLEEGEMSEYSYEEAEVRPLLTEEAINWQRTFSVNPVDFELLRSDWNDLRCNVSGNLQLAESEVIDVISQYMERLNERNGGIYTLVRIVNVEKRRDSARGNRYLVELLLMEGGKRVVRLSDYIYLLLHRSRLEEGIESREGTMPSSHHTPSKTPLPSGSSTQTHNTTLWSTSWAKPLLCQPAMLEWRHDVMVHFVVPVKNQARWVQQFISDMELLHRETKDENFSVIIVDFQSDDMDVEQALRKSTVPRYEYLRREGNFERSSGLQMGVDNIEDSHSIVFLCDLHIHFPHNILETIRKHCVEGRLAFAPIVMRLDCGSSPLEPDGFWEVNGFGLFGIYKSDFDKIGGMNTEEFKDRWGGEDWELLDRVLQNGLEVERLRLRNFYHYFHSKRGMWNIPIKRPSQG
ncbi:LOW QUALITY PROTEIN: N-acetyl-beta-glucosaminyl-glycoprotein 4-beta-N-acetylgalactosaminyltransferase 1 [Ctenopharyngodon idella]|uniref:LOW QUALITY PROTEIN: N-acetyl-beta-glucosaminyl-glycoprotein 4-beta-N-acetylgalactosaminyltransferase 1 n=1 Tax=Ctenopharyngodon idella TaxID=7959 RepID=UPI00222F5806|nr:LOW QUALITY PROTEIN: N-acetyl-beta-glucosaminyl-glycoprotein 4-beta-N-acetylgalactosaminyltransferase 1 [Ctenopharyngodon idella]